MKNTFESEMIRSFQVGEAAVFLSGCPKNLRSELLTNYMKIWRRYPSILMQKNLPRAIARLFHKGFQRFKKFEFTVNYEQWLSVLPQH